MRTLLHILWNAVTLASLALCVAVVALWVRGRTVADQVELGYWNYRPHPNYPAVLDASTFLAVHAEGRATFSVVRRPCVGGARSHRAGPGDFAGWAKSDRFEGTPVGGPNLTYGRLTPSGRSSAASSAWRNAKGTTRHAFAGVRLQAGPDATTASIPDWLLAAVFSAVPLPSVVRRLRRRGRHATGACPACGYDLRATPHRCPECGRIPSL